MISAVSGRGHMRFMVAKGRVNGAVFVEFLKRLMHNAAQPIFLILDGGSYHHSRLVNGLRGQLKWEAAIILSATLLPGTQSGRASLELPETPWCGQSWVAQREGTEKVRPGTSSFPTTTTLDHPHVLSYARHPVCGGLTVIYVYLLMTGLIAPRSIGAGDNRGTGRIGRAPLPRNPWHRACRRQHSS